MTRLLTNNLMRDAKYPLLSSVPHIFQLSSCTPFSPCKVLHETMQHDFQCSAKRTWSFTCSSTQCSVVGCQVWNSDLFPERIRTNHWHIFSHWVEVKLFGTCITAKDKRWKKKTKTLQQNSGILHRAALSGAGQSSMGGYLASCQLDLYIDMCNVKVGAGTWFKSSINIRCTSQSAPVWASNQAVAMASISSMKMMAGAFSFASQIHPAPFVVPAHVTKSEFSVLESTCS